MTPRQRFVAAMSGKPADRLPVIEWAPWWDLTIERWRAEGLPADLDDAGIKRFFGLDVDYRLRLRHMAPGVTHPGLRSHGFGIESMADYERVRPGFYPRQVPFDRELWKRRAEEHARGEVITWITVDGFFWWPRELFGVEQHLFAFYDQPEVMHRINQDLVDDIHHILDEVTRIDVPDFIAFAEDMSYNHGPMLSRSMFDTFLAPYYRQITPRLKQMGILIIVDSDGDVEPMIPWLREVGAEGILPLERMAGVDVNRVRHNHPDWRMIGGFDKMVMHLGEAAIRAEFQRLMPAMRTGYYIPSVDHQTPPAVSVEQYRLYVRLFHEYARKITVKT
jgi:hypothetical protein